ncbi:uncharacterized protein LY79DRAFT_573922 [Colletotrichum navitas]|uniref:Uncharacterized protein n=1 Tax=Colletotrichum navitas TaxID=681940 RepID=A0AAD8PJ81_9PEZI|nr:uncharacterized protein LY79DRAFT_573922 [Colletotrichum navitas]KAK1561729.1 hypothetical protein LY79DRAFT_573922 [Colletotrichum navitas]
MLGVLLLMLHIEGKFSVAEPYGGMRTILPHDTAFRNDFAWRYPLRSVSLDTKQYLGATFILVGYRNDKPLSGL